MSSTAQSLSVTLVQPSALGGRPVLLLLLQLASLLTGAVVLGRVAVRFGFPAVVGELLTGILLGPSVLGFLAPQLSRSLFPPVAAQTHLLESIGLLGVLLLVGVTGMQVDLRAMSRRRSNVVWVSICGLVVPLVLGTAAGLVVPSALLADSSSRWTFSLFLGIAMSVSAIPVIAKTLSDMRLLHRDIGQLTLAVAAVDDAVGWCLLAAVSAIAVHGWHASSTVISLVQLVGFLLIATVIGRRAVARVMVAAAAASSEAAVGAGVAVVLTCAAVAHSLALEAVFGAFVGGLLVGAAPTMAHVRPLAALRTITMSVLAPLAFAIAGLRVEIHLLTDPLVLVVGAAALLLAIFSKFVGAYAGARVSGLSPWEGIALGGGLNARGMVQIVVAAVGLRLGILTEATYTIIVLIAIATSVMAPPVLRLAMRHIEPTAQERGRESAFSETPPPLS